MAVFEFPTQTYNKGGVVFNQGETAKCMYDITKGRIGIYYNYGKPDEKFIAELKAGEYFGEMAVIESQSRSASAVSMEDGTTIQIINSANFMQYLLVNPAKMIMILQNMSRRIHDATSNYNDACKTIAAYLDAKEKGTGISDALQAKIDKFAEKGRKR